MNCQAHPEIHFYLATVFYMAMTVALIIYPGFIPFQQYESGTEDFPSIANLTIALCGTYILNICATILFIVGINKLFLKGRRLMLIQLYFSLNCICFSAIYILDGIRKHVQGTVEVPPVPVYEDCIRFAWDWVFRLWAWTCFDIMDIEKDKRQQSTDDPKVSKPKILGIKLWIPLNFQIAFGLSFVPFQILLSIERVNNVVLKPYIFKDIVYTTWLVLAMLQSIVIGLISVQLYLGIRRKNIAKIQAYIRNKVTSYFLLVIIAFAVTRIEEDILKTPVSAYVSISRVTFILMFIFELAQLHSLLGILRLRRKSQPQVMGGHDDTETVVNGYDFSYEVQNEASNSRHRKFQKSITLKNVRLDLGSMVSIGSGAFGNVVKCNITLRKLFGLIPKNHEVVAMKILKKETKDQNAEACLISELKTIVLAGNHEFITRFYGILQLPNDAVGMVLEFYDNGSLESYLRNHGNIQESDPDRIIKDSDLILQMNIWAFQIAVGMEHLTSKKIIHGDLACRNINLSNEKVAKICDFGLSHRLYNYQLYARSEQALLPWRHMALESLMDLKFSTKSDVWAYGVVLWEIFTIGQTPHKSRAWSCDFIQDLKDGQKLEKPLLASDKMYEEVMTPCWYLEPELRPAFGTIVQVILKQSEAQS